MNQKDILNSLIYPPKISSYKFDQYGNSIPERISDLLYDKFHLLKNNKKENEKNPNKKLKIFSLKNYTLFKELNAFDLILKLNTYKKNNHISYKQKTINPNLEDNIILIPKINKSYYTRENKIIRVHKFLINRIMGAKHKFNLSSNRNNMIFSRKTNSTSFIPINFGDNRLLKNKFNRFGRMSAKSRNTQLYITSKNQKNYKNKSEEYLDNKHNINKNCSESQKEETKIKDYISQNVKNINSITYNKNNNINKNINKYINNINYSENYYLRQSEMVILPYNKQLSSSKNNNNSTNKNLLNEEEIKIKTNNNNEPPLSDEKAYCYIEYSYPTNHKIFRIHSSSTKDRKQFSFNERYYKNQSNLTIFDSLLEKNKKNEKLYLSRNNSNRNFARELAFNSDKNIIKAKLQEFHNKMIINRNKINFKKSLSEKYAIKSNFYIFKSNLNNRNSKIYKNKRNRDLPSIFYYIK